MCDGYLKIRTYAVETNEAEADFQVVAQNCCCAGEMAVDWSVCGTISPAQTSLSYQLIALIINAIANLPHSNDPATWQLSGRSLSSCSAASLRREKSYVTAR